MMKRKAIPIYLVVICLLLATSCEMKIPNPIIGAYRLPRNDNVTDQACIYFGNDGTFEYYQFANDEIWWSKGTYTLTLGAYTFLRASGDIVFRVTDCVPSGNSSLLIRGTHPVKFDWDCDKDFGPQKMNLYFANTEITDDGYRCEYLGDYVRMEVVLDEWKSQIASQGGVK